MGGQCIVVRETPGSYPVGTPIFVPLPFREDSLETQKPLWELGLILIVSTSLTM